MTRLYLLKWREYEAGWGNRNDGYTVYPTIDAARKHIKDMDENKQYECFSSPDWDAIRLVEMDVPELKSDVNWFSDYDVVGRISSQCIDGKIVKTEHPPRFPVKAEYEKIPLETI